MTFTDTLIENITSACVYIQPTCYYGKMLEQARWEIKISRSSSCVFFFFNATITSVVIIIMFFFFLIKNHALFSLCAHIVMTLKIQLGYTLLISHRGLHRRELKNKGGGTLCSLLWQQIIASRFQFAGSAASCFLP